MKNRLNITKNSFDIDDNGAPMDGVSNMSDAMLVLAVGIMLALVINWKIDIGETYRGQETLVSVEEDKLQEFNNDDIRQNSDVSLEDVESKYVKSGTVYTDTVTGKTYVVID